MKESAFAWVLSFGNGDRVIINGFITRQQKPCYAMSPWQSEPDSSLPGTVHRGQLTDANQRLFFKRWLEFMTTETRSYISMMPMTKATEGEETA